MRQVSGRRTVLPVGLTLPLASVSYQTSSNPTRKKIIAAPKISPVMFKSKKDLAKSNFGKKEGSSFSLQFPFSFSFFFFCVFFA